MMWHGSCCRDTFAHMSISYSYVSCIEFDKPRPLLQAILGQLKVACIADSLSSSSHPHM